MSHLALARKWRPNTFEQMKGQHHVLRALSNALKMNRLHHAYLFSGTRGVGKTTLARIFAKCLNCEQGITETPCGKCAACLEISEARFVDLIEIDAASRTKVEDTREILENVQYAPSRGRFKVYLIDEAHMLSMHSFNALLKTLEEPPEHVKFLLATTDPQKLPITVLSRCLQFHLANLSSDYIVSYLIQVLNEEQVNYETGALWSLANAASGSMRDALSLVDQAIAYSNANITESEVASLLGTFNKELLTNLVLAIAKGEAEALLAITRPLSQQSVDFLQAIHAIAAIFHKIAVVQAVPKSIENFKEDAVLIKEIITLLSPEDVQLYYQMALNSQKDIVLANNVHIGFEMALLRMIVFRPITSSDEILNIGELNARSELESADENLPNNDIINASDIEQDTFTSQEKLHEELDKKKIHSNLKAPKKDTELLNIKAVTALPIHSSAKEETIETKLSGQQFAITSPNTAQCSEAETLLNEQQNTSLTYLQENNIKLLKSPWHQLLKKLNLVGVPKAIASHCLLKVLSINPIKIELALDQTYEFLFNEAYKDKILHAFNALLNEKVTLLMVNKVITTEKTPTIIYMEEAKDRLSLAQHYLANDPSIHLLIEAFGAKVVRQSIKVLN